MHRPSRSTELARANPIELAPSQDVRFTTDQTQLVRVIGNMLKNALEASAPGERVVARAAGSGPMR